MPRKKIKKASSAASVKRKASVIESMPMQEPEYHTPVQPMVDSPGFAKKTNLKAGLVILILAVIAILLVRKGYVVAAVVNGRPIYTWNLNQMLLSRFGQQQLEGMITEELIYQEAEKNGVAVSKEEIEAREAEMVKSVGSDVKLEDLLRFQGMTKEDFDKQIMLQLSVEKVLGKNIQFTDAQIDNYIATNSAQFTATDSAARKEQAKRTLMDEAINSQVQSWLATLKQDAKIVRILQ